jgi:hypothetical protein
MVLVLNPEPVLVVLGLLGELAMLFHVILVLFRAVIPASLIIAMIIMHAQLIYVLQEYVLMFL